MNRRLFHRRNRWMDDASAYADGELSAARRDAFRHELILSPELRQEVEDLRATKAVLASLPAAEPRRTYTLTSSQAGRRARPRPRAGGAALAGMRTAAAVSTIAIAALAAVVTVDFTADDMPRLAANGGRPTAALVAPQAATQVEESTTAAALDTTDSNAAADAPASATGLAQEGAMQAKGAVDEESSPAIAARSGEPPAEAAITTDTEAEETAPAEDGDSTVAALPPAPVAAGAASGEGVADIATAFSTDDTATSGDDWLLVLELALGSVGIVGIAAMFWLRRRGTA